jgi:hypothetical protein
MVGVPTVHHQHIAELDDLSWLAREAVDLEGILGGYAVLLTAGLDDCEHHSRPCVRYPALEGHRLLPVGSWIWRAPLGA